VFFWILVILPFLIVLGRILGRFAVASWDGLQDEIMVSGPLLLPLEPLTLMPFIGFVGFKLHGRFSLPKEERPHIRPLYTTARICFFVLSIVGMYYSLNRISHHIDNIVEMGVLQEPEETPEGDEQVRTTILAAVARAVATRDFDREIREALEQQDVAHAGIYIGLAERFNIEVSPFIVDRYQETQSFWNQAARIGTDCFVGGILRNTENLTQIICIVGSEFTIPFYADIADFVRQIAINPLIGQETDPFVVMGAVLGRVLDRRAHLLKHADTARHLRYVAGYGGINAAVIAARHARNVDEMRFAGRIARQFEGHTAGILHLLGKRTFSLFKHYRIAKSIQLALGGWAGLWALATTMLLSTLFSAVRGRVFKFITLRWLRRIDERRLARKAAA
jgi:hypothetical protein